MRVAPLDVVPDPTEGDVSAAEGVRLLILLVVVVALPLNDP